jgi:hypothetical protein
MPKSSKASVAVICSAKNYTAETNIVGLQGWRGIEFSTNWVLKRVCSNWEDS